MFKSRATAMLLAVLAFFNTVQAQTIVLQEADAIVWAQEQVIEGVLEGADAGVLHLDGEALAFEVDGGTFAVPVRLGEGTSALVACTDDEEDCTDTLRLTLGFELRPDALAFATASGRAVTLHGDVLANPDGAMLSFQWQQDPDNPAPVTLTTPADDLATFTFPDDAPPGEYYFDWLVTETEGDGDSFTARTFVTLGQDGTVRPFDLATDHAAWVDRAIVYEIAPRFFKGGFNGKFRHITESVPELVELGINTIWLQPIYATHAGYQAYDVTGYFETWDVLGPTEDLRELVETAHAAGLRVMLDFVPNHSSIHHPYALDAIAHGARSHYYDFYKRTLDDAPYRENYTVLTPEAIASQVGVESTEMRFISYFWPDLVMFNYQNPEVQRFIIEASRYWVEAFGIDGYRLDAVWGPHARNPAFMQEWRQALKRIKPELFLLAEAKAPRSEAFPPGFPDLFESFDAAYDWTDEADYISRWSLQLGERDRTIFNSLTERLRTDRLRDALTNHGQGFPEGAKVFRYIENNDTPRFVANHTDAQTKMLATLLFSLPGIPMMYYGQEVGTSTMFPSFVAGDPIRRFDRDGFFAHYQHLILLRSHFEALYSDHLEEVDVLPGDAARHVYSYRRWADEEDAEVHNIVGVINMADEETAVTIRLTAEALGLAEAATIVFTDLFTGETFVVAREELEAVPLVLPGSTTGLYAVAEAAVEVPTSTVLPPEVVADGLRLAPNYPNPFRTETTIVFEVPQGGPVRLSVYDLLGREVAVLLDRRVAPGRHAATLDARHLPSGVYFVKAEYSGQVAVQAVQVVR